MKIKVRWVITKGKSVFLVKEPDKGFYFLPWGTLEQGESFRQCLKRELREELGINAQLWEVILMREFEHADGPMLDVWIEVTNPEVLFSGPNKKATHGFEFCEPGFYFKDELSGETVQPVDLWRLLRVSPPIDIL